MVALFLLLPKTVLGFLGDSLTFAGAITLLIKEFTSLREYQEVEAARRHLAEFDTPFVAADGMPIRNAEDLQTSVLMKNAKRARCGALLITLGFLFLLLTRFLETADLQKERKKSENVQTSRIILRLDRSQTCTTSWWRCGHS